MDLNIDYTKKQAKFQTDSQRESSSFLRPESLHSKNSQGTFNKEILKLISERRARKLLDNGINVAPKFLESSHVAEKFSSLVSKAEQMLGVDSDKRKDMDFRKSEELSSKYSYTTMNITMDEIATQITLSIQSSTDLPIIRPIRDTREEILEPPKMPSYIKVILQETDDILLFEKGSVTVDRESEEAAAVIEDNKTYDYLTLGKGKNRRKMEAETQTVDILYKTRTANTERIQKLDIGTFVSNYDMFDTYADIQAVVTKVETNDDASMDITTYKHKGVDKFETLKCQSNFQLAVMLTQRLLAGNVFHEKQKRFRNMYLPDPLSLDVKYLYRLKELWIYKTAEATFRAVCCFDWCPANSDLLAVAYGLFQFVPQEGRRDGLVCIWSIKNPVNPERKYTFFNPVTAIAFSKQHPQLIAVGLYNGEIQILDITETNVANALVAMSQRSTSPGTEPVTEVQWIQVPGSNEFYREQLLAASEDGTIMKYCLTSGLYLVGYRQLKLDRVEGLVEGIAVKRQNNFIHANRNPQALMLKVHPEKADLYFVGTDEGCLHKCSTNYPNQHIDIFQMHVGALLTMEYSPWSPKIFLTCGSDWCIRVWIETIFEPVIHLSSGIGPVNSACWSPIHSTIIIGTTRNAVEVWDIRRNILRPVATRVFGEGAGFLTKSRFSTCGRSVVVGDEDGVLHVCALEDMPFPPHFQYKELESAIFKALVANPELTRHVESLGYLGYPKGVRQQELDFIDK